MKRQHSILVIDDEEQMLDSLRLNLQQAGYSVSTARSGEEALALFDGGNFDLVLCDLQLPEMHGMDVLKNLKEKAASTEVIIISAYGSIENAVEATKSGAFHFVEKPFEFDELQLLIDRALERQELIEESEGLRRTLRERNTYANIIGGSKKMQSIYEMIEAVAKSDANILIVGESGTGKELIANAIHYNSHRSKARFVKVNCASLPKELIESELFGHTKGAFTGAARDKEGLIASANGGSLLLDEIAEMPLELQPKLLRSASGAKSTIGSGASSLLAQVDLRDQPESTGGCSKQPASRRPLLRISTITIEVPPLRERAEDIQLLADHLLKAFSEKYGKRMQGFSQTEARPCEL